MIELISRQPPPQAGGVPLLCVHGILHGAWCYDEHLLPHLAQAGYPAYALSLRGHGGSARVGRLHWTSIRAYVEDVRHAVEQVARQHGRLPALIGHSMGGLIVQKYLEAHAAAGMVLLASVPVSGGLRALLKAALRFPLHMAVAPFGFRPILRDASAIRWMFFPPGMPAAEVERHRVRMSEESFRAILDLALLDRPRPARVPRVPALVIHAEADTLFTTGEGERTARAYQAEFVVIPGAAHDLMLDPTWPQTAAHIVRWLERELS